ncbi:MAG: hypothetical protein IJ609_00500 [Paludibacteraceae bacterium]|nr:hypothetical protein [Paludibacteraceae bacterium]
MKRLLLLTDAPAAPLYAPRMRHLISNLAQTGWNWIVVSERIPAEHFTFPDCTYLPFTFYKEGNTIWNKCLWLADKLFDIKEYRLLHFVRRHVQPSDIDAIVCSSFHTFPLPAAARLAREWHLPLLIDLRDIAEQWGDTPYMQHPLHTPFGWLNRCLTRLYTRHSVRLRNKALSHAQVVTTVSPWHQDVLAKLHPDVHLIYNGYDSHTFEPKDEVSDTFDITYTGKIYDFRLRSPQLLFQTLETMQQQGLLPSTLHVHFYCEPTIHTALQELAEQYHISHLVHIHSYVPQNRITPLLHQSSICLLLTNKASSSGPHGILTTKFFEALGVEKPVLCVRSDEECLARVIRDTNAGIAAASVAEVQAFILDKYREWQHRGYTRQPVNAEQKQLFTRRRQAQQFESLFLKLLNER